MTDRKFGPFEIERRLGIGGMGVVYLATYTADGRERHVALKVLSPGLSDDPKLLKRFDREIEILKRLTHPNIVKCFGGGVHAGQRYYAMEFINGGTIQDVMKKRGQLSVDQAIEVGRQLCAALEHAHNAGIIHRDLKPANLFVSKNGRLKLGDFGIARDTEATALTAAGKTVGTYAYMSPEQIHGGSPISRKTDLYATGCVLFEVLTGEAPFAGDNPAEMLMQHLNDDPRNVKDLVPDCPIWLDQLIERLLAKDPDDRPHDALAVHTELTEIRRRLQESTVSPPPTTAGNADGHTEQGTLPGDAPDIVALRKKKKKKKKRRKRDAGQFYEQTWFLVGCLVLLIAAGYWLSRPPGQEALYMSARTAMESNDEYAQRAARDDYMLPYLERFPDGQFAAEIQQWADDIQMDVLKAQALKKLKGNKDPRDAFEAAYIASQRAAQDEERHPLESIELLFAMTEQFGSDKDATHWVMLADRELAAGRDALIARDDRDDVIRERMRMAESMLVEGEADQARMIWRTFREVFYGIRDVERFYTYARRRFNGETYPLPGESDARDSTQ
jgi:eukaryotic-like serine/threonine-protein kinase